MGKRKQHCRPYKRDSKLRSFRKGTLVTNTNSDTTGSVTTEDLQATLAVYPEQHADDVASCSSSKKIKNAAVTNTAKDDHYLLLNFAVLKSIIADVGRCPKYTKCNINISNDFQNKWGFANKLVVMCELCEWNGNYYSSLPIEKGDKSPGKPAYDINIRAIYSFREIGRGYRSLCDFAMNMNIGR